MDKTFDFAIIGGDDRMAYMAAFLIERGYQVVTYGLDSSVICPRCKSADSLAYAVSESKAVIGPIPLSRDQRIINSVQKKEDLTIDNLKTHLSEHHIFYAGLISEALKNYGRSRNIPMFDFMDDEALTVYNTIATAEGAIAEAIRYQPSNLHNSRCLVLGFGRCAKTLAAKLQGLAANVAICARSPKALAEADAYGYDTFGFSQLTKNIGRFEYIFNTVPSQVLDETALYCIRKDALLLDIAPGGFDLSKAQELGVNARLSLSLPGKYAPKSSAEALTDLVVKHFV